jgi:hypothetical protein
VDDDTLRDFIKTHTHLGRRRFFHTQRWYLDLGLRGPAPAMLTLSVAPANPSAWPAWAARQATHRDSPAGVFFPGMRVHTAHLLASPSVPTHLRQALLEGHRLLWTGTPTGCSLRNYQSCASNVDLAAADMDRFITCGWLEGPLEYKPHVVNPMACIVKRDPSDAAVILKVRNVIDCRRSGVNEHLSRTPCLLDGLAHVVPLLQRHAGMSKIDIADAFLCWPIYAGDCDFQGVRHPVTGLFYRYRYALFGNSQSPSIQQEWARVIQHIVLTEGLRFCDPALPEGQYSNLNVAGAYLDDFMFLHAACLSPWQQALQFWSILCTLRTYGLPVKHQKSEWPHTCREYTGVCLDTTMGTVSLSENRRRALQVGLRLTLQGGPVVLRATLASLVGKLQWCVTVLPAGQAHLVECYKARDALVTDLAAFTSAAWLPDVTCHLSPAARRELLWWVATLDAPCVRQVWWPGEDNACLWTKSVLPSLPPDEDLALPSANSAFECLTTDASGWAGGAWWREHRAHLALTPQELAGHLGASSNLRELHMVPWALNLWGPDLAGSRVLIRLDNLAAVGAVNKGASMSPGFQSILLRLHSVLQTHRIQLVARHIPGVENTLADGISRLKGHVDDQDWRLDPQVHALLHARWGPFHVDACSDPLGRNAFYPTFWSELDSCLLHSWGGRHVYCNPPFRAAEEVLRHFWTCFWTAPQSSSAVFVLPVWTTASWWRLLRGGVVVGYFPAGRSLFTAPDWRSADRANPLPRTRLHRGPTRWPVVFVLFPQAAEPGTPRRWAIRRRLHGSAMDGTWLRALPAGILPTA